MFNLKFSKTTVDLQWAFISLAMSSFAHLLLRIVLGKELGPYGLGLYTLVFTIYMLAAQLSGSGIGQAMTKYISEYHDNLHKIKEYSTSGMIVSIVSGSIMGLLLYIFSEIISINFFHNPEMVNLLQITSICIPFIAIQKGVIGALSGLRKLKLYAFINIVQNIFIVILSIALVQLNMGVRGAIVGLVLPTILIGLLSIIFLRDYFTTELSTFRLAFKEVSLFGFYIVLTNSIGLINSQIDSVMLGHYINETAVGYYSIAVIFMEGLTLIPSSVQTVTDNRIVYYYARKDYENLIKLTKSSLLKVFIITIFEALGLIFFGQFLIKTIFGADFLPAYQPLVILIIGYSIFNPTLSISGLLPGIGKVVLWSKIAFICAVMNILLNILLVPNFGMKGAAIATSTALIFSTILRLYFTLRYIPKPTKI